MNPLVQMVLGLRGFVSEAVRAKIAYSLADFVASNMQDTNDWEMVGRRQFLTSCGLECPPAEVPDDSVLATTALARFVNKWSNVVAFKQGDKFVDLTEDMNAIRVTMVEELKDAIETCDGDNCRGGCCPRTD